MAFHPRSIAVVVLMIGALLSLQGCGKAPESFLDSTSTTVTVAATSSPSVTSANTTSAAPSTTNVPPSEDDEVVEEEPEGDDELPSGPAFQPYLDPELDETGKSRGQQDMAVDVFNPDLPTEVTKDASGGSLRRRGTRVENMFCEKNNYPCGPAGFLGQLFTPLMCQCTKVEDRIPDPEMCEQAALAMGKAWGGIRPQREKCCPHGCYVHMNDDDTPSDQVYWNPGMPNFMHSQCSAGNAICVDSACIRDAEGCGRN